MTYKKILVTTDFSEDSQAALHLAFKEFAASDNTLILLHVVNSSDDGNQLSKERLHAVAHSEIKESDQQDLRPTQLEKLKELVAPHMGQWKEIHTIVKKGMPTQCIVDSVKSEGVDLLIIGSHGEGGLRQMLFGSTTYDVARKVQCSVMISKRQ